MIVSDRDVDEAACPVRLFRGVLHVELRLHQLPQAKESLHWFKALHAVAPGHHVRAEEVAGVILVRGAGTGVRLPAGGIGHPGAMSTMGRGLVLWIGVDVAVDGSWFRERRDAKGYWIVVSGGRSHG